jgi:N-acetylglucosamine kinase-like BadF-type ATPase
MIAIAESGSTKCEWVILSNDGQKISSFKTQGFNPDFHNTSFVAKTLGECEEMNKVKANIEKLYFYGASCSSASLNKIIADGLAQVCTNAKIEVDHDLLAAAYSLYEGEPIITCILGTGSNSCYFDGKKVIEKVPALGFVIGDEAGGGYFGKRLLAEYFYNRLPQEIQDDFTKTYNLTWGEARKKIYGNIHANVYLASFMPFVAKHKDNPYINSIIREGIAKFIEVHVGCYSEMKKCKVGFVGSISHVLKDIILEELQKQGFELGKVVANPITQLVNYHRFFHASKIKASNYLVQEIK